ncbi:MAG: Rrf2 family transcriptional regulator, partial [Myxococcales bacterium]|nr:Rrf2 family transcriptional regulator [Myxococcales bacterium]
VAYTAQHLPAMEEAERKRLHAATAAEERQQKLNGRVAARLLVEVAKHFAGGRKAMPREDLVVRFHLPDDTVDALFSRLKERDLVVEIFGDVSGYMPARPLEEIPLAEVLDCFEGDELDVEEPDPLQRVLDRVADSREALLADLTLADLVVVQQQRRPATGPLPAAEGPPERAEAEMQRRLRVVEDDERA